MNPETETVPETETAAAPTCARINRRSIDAAAKMAAKEKTRFAFHALKFAKFAGGTRITATDGKALVALHCKDATWPGDDALIGLRTIAAAAKCQAVSGGVPGGVLIFEPDELGAAIVGNGTRSVVRNESGVFPDPAGVIPKTKPVFTCAVNPVYLANALLALEAHAKAEGYAIHNVKIEMFGAELPILATLRADRVDTLSFALVMPVTLRA